VGRNGAGKGASRTAQVYEAIIKRILSGEYRPGQAINRRDVAESLGLSVSPVGEAFALLQAEGILETVPRKGTFIGRLDWRDLRDLTQARAAIECGAARAYCGAQLRLERARFLELADSVDAQALASFEHLIADIRFHRALVRLAGNRYLDGAFDGLISRSLLLATEALMPLRKSKDENLSHRILVEELCRADAEGAEEIIRRNIYSGKGPIMEYGAQSMQIADTPEASGRSSGRRATNLDLVLGNLEER